MLAYSCHHKSAYTHLHFCGLEQVCLGLEGVLLHLLQVQVQESQTSLPALSVSSVFASTVESSACPGGTLNGTKHMSKSNASQLKELLLISVHTQLLVCEQSIREVWCSLLAF